MVRLFITEAWEGDLSGRVDNALYDALQICDIKILPSSKLIFDKYGYDQRPCSKKIVCHPEILDFAFGLE